MESLLVIDEQYDEEKDMFRVALLEKALGIEMSDDSESDDDLENVQPPQEPKLIIDEQEEELDAEEIARTIGQRLRSRRAKTTTARNLPTTRKRKLKQDQGEEDAEQLKVAEAVERVQKRSRKLNRFNKPLGMETKQVEADEMRDEKAEAKRLRKEEIARKKQEKKERKAERKKHKEDRKREQEEKKLTQRAERIARREGKRAQLEAAKRAREEARLARKSAAKSKRAAVPRRTRKTKQPTIREELRDILTKASAEYEQEWNQKHEDYEHTPNVLEALSTKYAERQVKRRTQWVQSYDQKKQSYQRALSVQNVEIANIHFRSLMCAMLWSQNAPNAEETDRLIRQKLAKLKEERRMREQQAGAQ